MNNMLADSSLGCEVECEPSNNNSLFSSQLTAGSLLAPGPQNEESETVSFVLSDRKHEESDVGCSHVRHSAGGSTR